MICKKDDNCFEVDFEWGDTQKYEHFREMCGFCLIPILKECRNVPPEKLKDFMKKNEFSNIDELRAQCPNVNIIVR